MVEIVFKGNDCWIDGVNRGKYTCRRENVLVEREGLTWKADSVGGFDYANKEIGMRIHQHKDRVSLWVNFESRDHVTMNVENLDIAFRLASKAKWQGSLLKTLEHMHAE